MKNFLIIVLSLSIIGCVHPSDNIVKPFVEPQYGMTQKKMMELLGKPNSIEIYKKTDQTRVEYDIYVINYQTSQLKIPICLINNKVVGWGKTYYQDHVSDDDIRIK